MDGSVIPPEVLEHLRSVHEERTDMTGWWATQDLAAALGVSENTARTRVGQAYRQGLIERRRFTVTDQMAEEMGLLGAGNRLMYRWKDAA